MPIPITDFAKLEMRVGRVVSVEDIPEARKPMYKMKLEFEEGVTRQCVAGIKGTYSKEDLVGKVVVAVVNLEPKSVAGVVSECMLLAASDESRLSLLAPERQVRIGSRVS
ncbi:MAG: tRNA-binding protein [Nitrososphaerota archaeon]|nr:tRNA-binding protein [Nitrososphaerota archaeon]MDG6942800.1 tRNA-binding protein [Nitrososphaerota archaeon]MDG6950880.1 tRNA-binding protein [Nitrososphaerota archaeon]